jgi:pimeloyl-[acyl-carrier protein] methyl ester esterase
MSNETLHVERLPGHGPPLVLLHGWAMHTGVWGLFAQRLSLNFDVYAVDLPGHGRSRAGTDSFTLESCADAVLKAVPDAGVWLGWSLGGVLALAAALQSPSRIKQLVLIGATPKFVQSPDWPDGVSSQTLEKFSDDLQRDYAGTVSRFLSLQLGEAAVSRDLLRTLRQNVLAGEPPGAAALQSGLSVLKNTDLRTRVNRLRTPTLVVHGARDRLVPSGAGEFLARSLPAANFVRLEDAGHVPFLSHPNQVVTAIENFISC